MHCLLSVSIILIDFPLGFYQPVIRFSDLYQTGNKSIVVRCLTFLHDKAVPLLLKKKKSLVYENFRGLLN